MRIRNSEMHFGAVAILFHWVMAFLIIALLGLGLYMVALPISIEKLKLYGWHKEYGMLALILVTARSMWRVTNLLPELSLPWWEALAARLVHYLFYGFMFAMPITGWIMTSATGLPVSYFGWFVFPNLVSQNLELMGLFQLIHKWLGYGLIVMIILHSSAALKHHFINKDNILWRMLTW